MAMMAEHVRAKEQDRGAVEEESVGASAERITSEEISTGRLF